MRIPVSACLTLKSPARMAPSSALRKLPHQESLRLTRTACSGTDVSTHGATALFNPPADGALRGIVGAIERFPCGAFPRSVARQAMPEILAIQEQESQAIGHTLARSPAGQTAG